MRLLLKKKNKSYKTTNSSSSKPRFAAAADLFDQIEIEEAVKALTLLDLAEPIARTYATRDHRLALVVATYAATRFQAAHLKPIPNKIGFLRKALDAPQTYGFQRLAGGDWIPPKDSAPPPSSWELRWQAACAKAQREAQQR